MDGIENHYVIIQNNLMIEFDSFKRETKIFISVYINCFTVLNIYKFFKISVNLCKMNRIIKVSSNYLNLID